MADPDSIRLGGADSPLIPRLPDDLSVQCIARVPRFSHPALVLVSRSWRSLLRSRRLFDLRAKLGATEPSLFINIGNPLGETRWYFFNLRPCRLLPLPPNPFPTFGAGCAVLGSSLYVLGGFGHRSIAVPSSAVQIYDPCLNRWITGPPMAEARRYPVVNALDGRIYVFGGCVSPSQPWYRDYEPESGAWAEVFDPESGAWSSLPRRPAHLRNRSGHTSAVFRGQLLLDDGLLFDPEAAQPWGTVPKALMNAWAGRAVVLDGVLYSYNFMRKLGGYDQAAGIWKPVEGVEGELPQYWGPVELTSLGGLLCLVWVSIIQNAEGMEPIIRGMTFLRGITPDMNFQSEIHCVGVQIARTSCGGFGGSIAWREVVAMPISGGMVTNVTHSVVLEF